MRATPPTEVPLPPDQRDAVVDLLLKPTAEGGHGYGRHARRLAGEESRLGHARGYARAHG